MADVKFSCPHCQQHIQADSGYGGMQINCPACNGSLLVPGTALPPAPVMAPAPVPVAVRITKTPSPAASGGCPSCGAALPRGAVLCTGCGYNLATGQRTVAGRPAALNSSAPQYEVPWLKTPYPYLGVVALLLVVFYFLGKGNPLMMLAFVGTAVLYSLTVHIIVLVAAFKESVGTGFLALCLPFYAFYFVFKVQDNDTLKILYGFAAAINIGLRFID